MVIFSQFYFLVNSELSPLKNDNLSRSPFKIDSLSPFKNDNAMSTKK